MCESSTVPGTSASSRPTLCLFATLGGILAAAILVYYAKDLHGRLPFLKDDADYIIGRDFFNTWLYGRAAVLPDPGRFYDHAVYVAWFSKLVPENVLDHIWSYPPQFFLMATPFGQLPYLAALLIWTLIGLLALYAAVRGSALRTFAILVSPAVLFCAIFGQISMLVAACSLGALRLLDRRPWLAGALIACITVKPQAGLLFPVLLLATRRWRVLIAATLCTAILVALTTAIWGIGIWTDYFHLGIPAQIADMRTAAVRLMAISPTILTGALTIGANMDWALPIQFLFTALAIVFVATGCGGGPLDARRIALFLACSAFASPYLLVHDLTALTAAVVLLAGPSLTGIGRWLAVALYLAPVIQPPLASLHVPGVALVPVAFALWAIWPQWRMSPLLASGEKEITPPQAAAAHKAESRRC